VLLQEADREGVAERVREDLYAGTRTESLDDSPDDPVVALAA
jgi:hypothetical protein